MLGNLACTTRHHEVCTADEDGDGGGGCGEDWERCGMFPMCILEVVDPTIVAISAPPSDENG